MGLEPTERATQMTQDDEIVQYLIFRRDLPLSKGKLAAQAGHAVQLGMDAGSTGHGFSVKWFESWLAGSYTKIALVVDDILAMDNLEIQLNEADILYGRVVDEGRTEVPAGTTTALGLQPLPKSVAKQFVGGLRLL